MRENFKKNEFEHLLKKMDYDRKVFEIWKHKVATVQGARQHAKQEHLVSEHRRLSDSVENYIDGRFRFLSWDTCKNADSLIPQILGYRMEALKKIRSAPASCSDIPTVVLMNWTAPCLFANTRQKDHCNVLSWALHDNSQSVGVVFFPTFSYKKGKTYLEEGLALSTLTHCVLADILHFFQIPGWNLFHRISPAILHKSLWKNMFALLKSST